MHPEIFKFKLPWDGEAVLRSYGLMLALAALVGIFLTFKEAKRKGQPPERVLDIAVVAILAGIVGARLTYVILNWRGYYASRPQELFYIWQGGISFQGSLLGAVIGLLVYAKVKKLKFWELADLCVPALPLSYAIGRVGCFLNGCCYGTHCDLPWGVTFPPGSLASSQPPPIHPTQIYDIILSLILFLVINRVKLKPSPAGYLTTIYLIGYSIERFIVEIFRRGASARPLSFFPALTQAQLASILIIILAVVMLLKLRYKAALVGKARH